jgi:hypothetical protein
MIASVGPVKITNMFRCKIGGKWCAGGSKSKFGYIKERGLFDGSVMRAMNGARSTTRYTPAFARVNLFNGEIQP